MNGKKIFAGPANRYSDCLAADRTVCDRRRSDAGAGTVRGGGKGDSGKRISRVFESAAGRGPDLERKGPHGLCVHYLPAGKETDGICRYS